MGTQILCLPISLGTKEHFCVFLQQCLFRSSYTSGVDLPDSEFCFLQRFSRGKAKRFRFLRQQILGPVKGGRGKDLGDAGHTPPLPGAALAPGGSAPANFSPARRRGRKKHGPRGHPPRKHSETQKAYAKSAGGEAGAGKTPGCGGRERSPACRGDFAGLLTSLPWSERTRTDEAPKCRSNSSFSAGDNAEGRCRTSSVFPRRTQASSPSELGAAILAVLYLGTRRTPPAGSPRAAGASRESLYLASRLGIPKRSRPATIVSTLPVSSRPGRDAPPPSFYVSIEQRLGRELPLGSLPLCLLSN